MQYGLCNDVPTSFVYLSISDSSVLAKGEVGGWAVKANATLRAVCVAFPCKVRYSSRMLAYDGIYTWLYIYISEPPVITKSPIDLFVNEKGIARFHCEASGDPVPNITWVKTDDNLDSRRTSVQSDNSLVIRDINPSDEGSKWFLCLIYVSKAHVYLLVLPGEQRISTVVSSQGYFTLMIIHFFIGLIHQVSLELYLKHTSSICLRSHSLFPLPL